MWALGGDGDCLRWLHRYYLGLGRARQGREQSRSAAAGKELADSPRYSELPLRFPPYELLLGDKLYANVLRDYKAPVTIEASADIPILKQAKSRICKLQ